jgi:hypothetical protein
MSKNKDKGPELPKALSLDDLRLIVDPIVESLSKKVGERGAVVLMVSAPNGTADSYYVRWSGPLLTARGLREEGSKLLDATVAKPVSSVQTGPA